MSAPAMISLEKAFIVMRSASMGSMV
jgi:hypothetical protein